MEEYFRQVNKPLQLISRLANRALDMKLFGSIRPKIGQQILSLTEREREILKRLKSNDIKNVRWPPF